MVEAQWWSSFSPSSCFFVLSYIFYSAFPTSSAYGSAFSFMFYLNLEYILCVLHLTSHKPQVMQKIDLWCYINWGKFVISQLKKWRSITIFIHQKADLNFPGYLLGLYFLVSKTSLSRLIRSPSHSCDGGLQLYNIAYFAKSSLLKLLLIWKIKSKSSSNGEISVGQCVRYQYVWGLSFFK